MNVGLHWKEVTPSYMLQTGTEVSPRTILLLRGHRWTWILIGQFAWAVSARSRSTDTSDSVKDR